MAEEVHLLGEIPVAEANPATHAGESSALLKPTTLSYLGPYAAIVLNLAVIAFLVIAVVIDIPIRSPGSLSTTDHTLYITSTTILATIIANFNSSQIRLLWLSNIISRHALNGNASSPGIRRARTLLGLADWLDQLKLWRISLSLIITSLTTTAIVAGITPSSNSVFRSTRTFLFTGYSNSTCSNLGLVNEPFSSCLTKYAIDLVFDTYLTDTYPYDILGIPVNRYAIGTPLGIGETSYISPPSLDTTGLTQYKTGCFPVLTSNPIQCHQTGTVTIGTNNVTVEADGCTIVSPIFAVDPATQPATSKGVCKDTINCGQGTIVIGAVNGHAGLLAEAMFDTSFTPPSNRSATYSVSCTVEIAPSIEFRTVNFSRIASATWLSQS